LKPVALHAFNPGPLTGRGNWTWLIPGHVPTLVDAGALLRGYIAHRLEREAQIIDALRSGDTALDALVARVYPELERHLLARARETVTAHLLKLERDGRAGRRGDAWHIIGP